MGSARLSDPDRRPSVSSACGSLAVLVVVVVLVDEDGLDYLDVLLGRRVLRQRHRNGQDAAVVGGVDLVLVGADGQRDGARERSVREFRVTVRFAGLGRVRP